MARVLSLIVYLLIAVVALKFALLNAQSAHFNYYFGQTDLPMSLLMALAVVAGAMLGVIVSLGMVFRARRQAAQQRRLARNAQKELEQLRGLTHQDQDKR
jgi:putative membrane protein